MKQGTATFEFSLLQGDTLGGKGCDLESVEVADAVFFSFFEAVTGIIVWFSCAPIKSPDINKQLVVRSRTLSSQRDLGQRKGGRRGKGNLHISSMTLPGRGRISRTNSN